MKAEQQAQRSPIDSARSAALVAVVVGLVVGISLLAINPTLVSIVVVAVAVVVAIFVKPELGLFLYLGLEYLRPADRYPSLAPLHLTRLVAGAVLVAWLLSKRFGRKEPFVSDPQNVALLAFLAIMALSTAQAYWKGIAATHVLTVAKAVAVYFLIANLLSSQRRLGWFIWVFLAVNAWLAAEQCLRFRAVGGEWGSEAWRLGALSRGFLADSNDFAMALLIALPFAYFGAWYERSWGRKAILIGLAALFVGSIAYTGSRGGVIGLAAVVLALWLKSPRRGVGLALVGVLMAAWWIVAPPKYLERVQSIFTYQSEETAQIRMRYWGMAQEMWRDRPLLGYGPANFATVSAKFYTSQSEHADWRTVHSVYFQALAELGILGLAGFLLVAGLVVRDTVRSRRALAQAGLGQTGLRATSDALEVSLAAYLVTGAFLSALYYPHLYVLAAMAVATYSVSRRRAELAEREARAVPAGEAEGAPREEAAP